MWISVDRYLAVRKPLRYETVQTRTSKLKFGWSRCIYAISNSLNYITFPFSILGCQCWMCFTWISAAMLCCPALWTEKESTYDGNGYICVPNWNHMAAYSVTLGKLLINFWPLSLTQAMSSGILVLGPSVISIVYNYGYIFSMMRKLRSGVAIHDKEWVSKALL